MKRILSPILSCLACWIVAAVCKILPRLRRALEESEKYRYIDDGKTFCRGYAREIPWLAAALEESEKYRVIAGTNITAAKEAVRAASGRGRALVDDIDNYQTILRNHPRAAKLARETGNFLVLRYSHPAAGWAWSIIRDVALAKGKWTADDEARYCVEMISILKSKEFRAAANPADPSAAPVAPLVVRTKELENTIKRLCRAGLTVDQKLLDPATGERDPRARHELGILYRLSCAAQKALLPDAAPVVGEGSPESRLTELADLLASRPEKQPRRLPDDGGNISIDLPADFDESGDRDYAQLQADLDADLGVDETPAVVETPDPESEADDGKA